VARSFYSLRGAILGQGMDGDLGRTEGRSPRKIEVGETVHASVPSIGEVVLLEACEVVKGKRSVKEQLF